MPTIELSSKAARALDQVKSGLSMLYMVDYFTEDEWMKIDVCIHKGKYVFTKGPPKHILDLDMSDDGQSSEASMSLHLQQADHLQSVERQEKEEEIAPVESAEDTTDAIDSGPGSTLDLSSPPSSIEEPAEFATSDVISSWVDENKKEDEEGNSFELSLEMSQPPPAPKPVEAPPINNRPTYTKEQLEEAKAMNRCFTKAPETGSGRARKVFSQHKENYRVNESYPLEDAMPETEEWMSSNTPEDNHRINQWATETEPASRNWSQADPVADLVERLVAEFIQKTGRVPKHVNDIYQPNNHQYQQSLTARPDSRTTSVNSRQSAEFAKSLASVVGRLQPKTDNSMTSFKPGVVLIAQTNVNDPSKVGMGVKIGDSIKVVKHVSGIFHLGENLTSGKFGQFSEDIFSRPHQQVAASIVSESPASKPETASVVDLDQFERHNAAQWDEVPAPKRARERPAPAVKSNFGGLAKSKYAVLEDELPASSSCSEQDPEHGTSREVAGIEYAKFDPQQQSDAQMPPLTGPRRPRQLKSGWKEPLKPVPPRRETCTMWAIATCRFKAEECRDLHAIVDLPPGQEPRNLRDGKPTWGALADYQPPPTEITSPFMNQSITEHSSQVSGTEDRRLQSPPMSPSTPRNNGSINSGSKFASTCPFWATTGENCYKSAEQCQFMHAWTDAGVAPKPRGFKAQSKSHTQDWKRWDNPSHPARNPENQTFRPAPGGHEWRALEEEREKQKSHRGDAVDNENSGYQPEERGRQAAWDRSGPVEPGLANSGKPAWDKSSGSTVETPPADKTYDADGWVIDSQQDLKQEIGW